VNYSFQVTDETLGMTLDRFLALRARFSLEEARELVRFGSVWVNRNRETDCARRLEPGQDVSINIPRHGVRRHYEADPGRILFRDPWILAYNKEAGVPCQSTPYDAWNNVFEGLRRMLGDEPVPKGGGPARRGDPGGDAGYLALHHRLDLSVSGVMMFALSQRANKPLFEAFRDRRVEKVYRAVVCGEPREDGWVETAPIGRKAGKYLCVPPGRGKAAETAFRVIRRVRDRALVEALPRTGRTHQIRLHLALCGLPILGDRQYGGRPYPRTLLHALRLSLAHPVKKKYISVEAPVSVEFSTALKGGKEP
jgi:23S rRNA pseudouridine1911/1915/1917 synthase